MYTCPAAARVHGASTHRLQGSALQVRLLRIVSVLHLRYVTVAVTNAGLRGVIDPRRDNVAGVDKNCVLSTHRVLIANQD